MLEYITVGLGIIAGISAAVAFIYRRGLHDGIDSECESRIKTNIKTIEGKVDVLREDLKIEGKHGDKVHKEIFENVHKIDVKIEKLQSSTDIIKDLITNHITKKD